MNVLIITTLLPYPLTSGGAQAQFNMIDELRHMHHITLLCTEDRNNRRSTMKKLQSIWPEVNIIRYPYLFQIIFPTFFLRKLIRGIQTLFFSQSVRFQVDKALHPICIHYSWLLKRYISQLIRRKHIDIVQTEFYSTIGLVKYLPLNVKTVFIQHEIHYKKNERYFESLTLSEKQQHDALLARSYEISCMNAYDIVVTLTDVDKVILKQDGVTSTIVVSPAGIKAELQPFYPFEHKLCFVGSSQHTPNLEGITWLQNQVLPLVRDKLTFNIIGLGWPRYSSINQTIIQSIGFMPSLSQAMRGSIMLVPILSGSGMRMKILEAAASSIPFITTTIGVEGLDFVHNESCLIADTPEDFAQAIHKLASDEDLQRQIATKAHQVFMQKYTIHALALLRNKIYL